MSELTPEDIKKQFDKYSTPCLKEDIRGVLLIQNKDFRFDSKTVSFFLADSALRNMSEEEIKDLMLDLIYRGNSKISFSIDGVVQLDSTNTPFVPEDAVGPRSSNYAMTKQGLSLSTAHGEIRDVAQVNTESIRRSVFNALHLPPDPQKYSELLKAIEEQIRIVEESWQTVRENLGLPRKNSAAS